MSRSRPVQLLFRLLLRHDIAHAQPQRLEQLRQPAARDGRDRELAPGVRSIDARRLLAEGKTVKIFVVGRKGYDILRRQYADLIVEHVTFRTVDAKFGPESEAEIRVKTLLGSMYLSLEPDGEGELKEEASASVARFGDGGFVLVCTALDDARLDALATGLRAAIAGHAFKVARANPIHALRYE